MKNRSAPGHSLLPGILFLLLAASHGDTPAKQQEPVVMTTRLISADNDSLVTIELVLKMGPDIHIFSPPSQFFEIKTVKNSGTGPAKITLPKSKPYKNPDGTKAAVFTGKTVFTITCPRISDTWNLRGYIQFQACDKNKCFFPEKRWFEFASDTVGTGNRQPSP